ncbi:MAG: Phosphoenolpyruvate synthase [Candidatus Giovannonibacteria bacterium GW2011_GWA2_53_7]|uniref:Phosphoenolpyruvate synthase n=1 Tax=Candidatus Giovannonibacteria bacterium GW2011_GWA2_53_7 TaxID=1618650 RepID=A0A0G1XVK3_9BACT|nr:MAG: Phosphoenolpyruvate synthase [Candidatus Giovannonibacteria bacterium GW2011_GWA2_53_7]
MNLKQIEKKIDQHTWWLEEAPGLLQVSIWAWHAFIEQQRHLFPRCLSLGLFFQKGDYMWEFTPQDEKERNFAWLVKRTERNYGFVKRLYREWLTERMAALSLAEKLKNAYLTARMPSDLSLVYRRYIDAFIRSGSLSVLIENADPYTSSQIFSDVQKALPELTAEQSREFILTMTAPVGLLYVERERRDLLTAAIKSYAWLKSKRLNWPEFEKHQARAASDFTRLSRSLLTKPARLRKTQAKLRRSHRLPHRLATSLKILSFFSLWQDQRKELGMRLVLYHLEMCARLSQLTGRPAWHFQDMGLKDMLDFLGGRGGPSPAESRHRRQFSVYVTEPAGRGSRGRVLAGRPARQLFKRIMRQQQSSKDLSGVIACAPELTIRGRAQVILNPATQKFTAGRILVTTMTRPEFMPYMRKAKAIITDEGGLTAHAAVIARELKLPCIIGTRNATRMIRNGQTVEMDLRSGRITVLKS